MNILVYEININNDKKNIIQLRVYNKCGKTIRILIKNYKIKLFGCKNRHEINNISFEEFETIKIQMNQK